jgi:hypothetical protein
MGERSLDIGHKAEDRKETLDMTTKTITNSAEESKNSVLQMVLLFHSGGRWDRDASDQWIRLQSLAGIANPHTDATSSSLCKAVRHALAQKSKSPETQTEVQIRCVDEDGTEVDFRPTEELMVKRLVEQELMIKELEAFVAIFQKPESEPDSGLNTYEPYHGGFPFPIPE